MNRIHIYKRVLWTATLISVSMVCFSQSNEIKIRFIANTGLYMTDGHSNIYIDFPYKSGFSIYSKYDRSEITNIKDSSVFIFTHKHPDHYSRKVKKLKGKRYGPWNIKEMEQLGRSIQNFSIVVFKTKHKFSFHHCSYLITWHGKKIFINGDAEDAGTVSKISNMDWAFLPGWTMMNVIRAKIKIDAKMVGIYHIGPKDHVNSDDPKIHVMDKQGEIITLPY